MKKLLLATLIGLVLASVSAPQVYAGAFTVTFTQVGNNVVATASGSINLSGLSLIQSATDGYGDCASVEADAGSFDVGGSGPCAYTTPGLATSACPSGEELQTFSVGIITLGEGTGPATGSLCANYTPADLYGGLISGPQTFGAGATGTCVNSPVTISGTSLVALQPFCFTESSSSTGDIFGFYQGVCLDQTCSVLGNGLEVPAGYHSGDPLSGSSIWNNTTLARLGVTPGIYTWTWGTVADPSITVDVQAAPAPEPSSPALLGAGLLGLGLASLRRHKAA